MEEVNRRRRTVLQVQMGEPHLWRLSQSSSPRKCRFHLGFSLVLQRNGVQLRLLAHPCTILSSGEFRNFLTT